MILFSLRKPGLLAVLWLALGGALLLGQTPRDLAVELNAIVQQAPPSITLQWNATGYTVTEQKVYRRLKNAASWGAGTTLANTATSYTDTSVSVGVSYEYRVTRTMSNGPGAAFGYVSSGIRVPVVADRGRVILLVDDTMATPLATELTRLAGDLTGDGWTVIRRNVSRTASPPTVRASIQSIYNASPTTNTALILFGHIPVPYSGNEAMDGHPEHVGAWPTDIYYGDIDGTWTDSAVNNIGAAEARNQNIPGDGKFDQTEIPSDVELQVGRIDLANMSEFGVSETELLRRYLDRDHAYRHKLGGFASVGKRGLVDDNFGFFGGEAFAVSAWRSFTACVGAGNVDELDWFGTLQTASYLWAYGCGGGSPVGAGGVGSTGDFATKDSRAVFTMLFGSYFGDWDRSDAFLRAPLAGTVASFGLVSCWAGRPHWFFHPMALGETVGYSARITQNNPYDAKYFPLRGYNAGFGARYNHVALLGDPTLRLYPVAPPTNLTASVASNAVTLNWNASTDPGIEGYLVARGSSAAGPFVLLQSGLVAGTTFVDGTVASDVNYTYLVRAVKAQTSPTGSYLNSSQGAFLSAGVVAGIAIYPPAIVRSIHAGSAVTETLNISNPGTAPLVHTITSSPGSESWLSLAANAGTIPPGGVQQIGVTLNAAGLALGDYAAELIVASNALGGASVTIPVRLTVGKTPFENWQLIHFGPAPVGEDAADAANADGDAGDNLIDYALGRDPRIPEATSFVTTEVNAAGYLQIRFERDATHTDLRYIVEAASSLTAAWTPIASSIHGAPVIATGAHSSTESGAGDTKSVIVEDSARVATFANRFLRLRIVRD